MKTKILFLLLLGALKLSAQAPSFENPTTTIKPGTADKQVLLTDATTSPIANRFKYFDFEDEVQDAENQTLSWDGGNNQLTISGNPGNTVDLSSLVSGDNSATNELITAFSIQSGNIRITEAGVDWDIALSTLISQDANNLLETDANGLLFAKSKQYVTENFEIASATNSVTTTNPLPSDGQFIVKRSGRGLIPAEDFTRSGNQLTFTLGLLPDEWVTVLWRE